MRRITSDEGLADALLADGYDFFCGVPDSSLRRFIDDLGGVPPAAHVTATWEAEAVGIAAGVSLTGGRPCVYMQNAGLGHAINPLTSLCIPYEIEMLLVVGHRHTLPQHRVMGDIDVDLLRLIGWDDVIVVDGSNHDG